MVAGFWPLTGASLAEEAYRNADVELSAEAGGCELEVGGRELATEGCDRRCEGDVCCVRGVVGYGSVGVYAGRVPARGDRAVSNTPGPVAAYGFGEKLVPKLIGGAASRDDILCDAGNAPALL